MRYAGLRRKGIQRSTCDVGIFYCSSQEVKLFPAIERLFFECFDVSALSEDGIHLHSLEAL